MWKTLCNSEPQVWPEIITARDAKSTCFKGSRTSCEAIIFDVFLDVFWPKKIASRDGCVLLTSLRELVGMNSQLSPAFLHRTTDLRSSEKSWEDFRWLFAMGKRSLGVRFPGPFLAPNLMHYPLARNQYINNSPGIFSCIRAGANTGATCIRPEIISLKNLANMQKMTPQKYFPVFARVRIQAPHVFAKKLIPQEFFPACIGFVPGGNVY